MGDLNVHFDNPSDPCTAALNVVFVNFRLEQLVNVPIHLEVRQATAQPRQAERKWRQSCLTVRKEMYAKQRKLMSNLIRKDKKDCMFDKKMYTVIVPGAFLSQ